MLYRALAGTCGYAMSTNTLSDYLRTHTQTAHQNIERVPAFVRLLESTYTLAEYRILMKHWLAFVRSHQARLEQHLFLPRPELNWLNSDCKALGLTTMADLGGSYQIQLDTPQACWGYAYVLEGSHLGAQVISKSLRQTLPPQAHQALQFYQGHGRQTRAHWQHFIQALNQTYDVRSSSVKPILAAALETFTKLQHWFEGCATQD